MNAKIFIVCIVALALGVSGVVMMKNPNNNEPEFISKDEIMPADTVVKMTAEGFVPAEITVEKGDKVVWLNESGTYAWPASDLHPTHSIYPEFDPLEPIPQGQAWVFIFEEAGQWKFHDHLKPNRRGQVVVQ